MKTISILTALACAALVCGCAATQSNVEHSGLTLTQAKAHDDELRKEVHEFYLYWNASPIGRQADPPYIRHGRFLAARYFAYGDSLYAVVRVMDSTIYVCNGCSQERWQDRKQQLTAKFEKNTERTAGTPQSETYGTDDERMWIFTIKPSHLYAVLRPDRWHVQDTPMEISNNEMLWRKFREEEEMKWE
jgi:hypothetical protein